MHYLLPAGRHAKLIVCTATVPERQASGVGLFSRAGPKSRGRNKRKSIPATGSPKQRPSTERGIKESQVVSAILVSQRDQPTLARRVIKGDACAEPVSKGPWS